ncbi:MAG: tRNA dihydrouridine synthase DusB [Ruminococcaceae bacterium]|nr:tRNA dihydrouridine synthase DusB [Oscillospiraceae bacterium]
MKIGNIELKNGLFLAPLAGVSDRAFREVCRKHGAECTVSEMISAKGLHYNDTKTAVLAAFSEGELPFFIQIFGSDPEIMAESAVKLATNNYKACQNVSTPSGIDINMGCPVPKIAGNGDGSALMKKPVLAGEIIKAVSSAVNIPVTVKIRSGWDGDSKNAVELAEIAEKNGAMAICVHGRTKMQMYRDPVDIDIIKQVKKSVSIPVIANGGINDAESALKMLEYTDCDGLMIARGAMGNPFLFKEIACAIEGKDYTEPTMSERLAVAMEHIRLMIGYKGEYTGVMEARKHLSWYIQGKKGAAVAREKVNKAMSLDELETIVEQFLREYE